MEHAKVNPLIYIDFFNIQIQFVVIFFTYWLKRLIICRFDVGYLKHVMTLDRPSFNDGHCD